MQFKFSYYYSKLLKVSIIPRTCIYRKELITKTLRVEALHHSFWQDSLVVDK